MLIYEILKKVLFVNNCRFDIANGYSTPFWHSKWIDDFYLNDMFPLLFGLSKLKKVVVTVMGVWREGVWCWGGLWFSNPFGEAAATHSFGVETLAALVRGLLEHLIFWSGIGFIGW